MKGRLSAISRRARETLRRHLIDEWHAGWRFWSVRIQAIAVSAGAILAALPQELIQLWATLPPEARHALPPGILRWLPIILGIAAIAARFLRQKGGRHG